MSYFPCDIPFMSEEELKENGIVIHKDAEHDWEKAKNTLNMWIAEYASIGIAGQFGLQLTLLPLKRRFDSGERTQELYDEIMNCE